MSLIPKLFVKGVFFSASSALLVGLSGYLSRRLMANNLSETDYAFYYSTLALLSLMLIFTHLGTSDFLLYELPGMLAKKQNRRACFTYHYITRLLTILAVICFFVLFASTTLLKKYYFDYPVSNVYLWAFFLLIVGYTLENSTLFTLNSLKKFAAISYLRAAKAVGFLLAVCIALQTAYPLLIIILSIVFITSVCSWLGMRMINKNVIFTSCSLIPRSIKRDVIKGGMVFILLSGGYTLMQDFGTFTLSLFSTANEVVLFNIALPISMIVISFTVVMQVFTPMIAESYYNQEYRRLRSLFKWLFAITAALVTLAIPVLLFWGRFIITLLFSEKFVNAHLCTFFLVETAILSIPVRAFLSFFNAIGRRIVSVKCLIPTALAAFVFYPLLSFYAGASGAGVAALITVIVWLLMYIVYYIKLIFYWGNL